MTTLFSPVEVTAELGDDIKTSAANPTTVVAATAGSKRALPQMGVANGAWLHRPILRYPGISTLAATAACIGACSARRSSRYTHP